MKCLLIAIASLSSLSFTSALVHFKAMEKGKNGCKINKTEVAVGEFVQDTETCGIIACQNTDGDAYIHYCQIPATFAECPDTAVLTTMDFPQCCWTCASWGKCGNDTKNSTASGSKDSKDSKAGAGATRSGAGGYEADGYGAGSYGADGYGEGSYGAGGYGADGPGSGGTGGDGSGADGTEEEGTGEGGTEAGGSGEGGTEGGGAEGGRARTAERQTKFKISKTHQMFVPMFKKPVKPITRKELDIKIGDGTPKVPQEITIKNHPSEERRTNPVEPIRRKELDIKIGDGTPKVPQEITIKNHPSEERGTNLVEPIRPKELDNIKIGDGTPKVPQEITIKDHPSEELGTNP